MVKMVYINKIYRQNELCLDRKNVLFSSGLLSQPLLLLYCMSLFSLNTSTPTAAFISAEGKEEQSRGGCD